MWREVNRLSTNREIHIPKAEIERINMKNMFSKIKSRFGTQKSALVGNSIHNKENPCNFEQIIKHF